MDPISSTSGPSERSAVVVAAEHRGAPTTTTDGKGRRSRRRREGRTVVENDSTAPNDDDGDAPPPPPPSDDDDDGADGRSSSSCNSSSRGVGGGTIMVGAEMMSRLGLLFVSPQLASHNEARKRAEIEGPEYWPVRRSKTDENKRMGVSRFTLTRDSRGKNLASDVF